MFYSIASDGNVSTWILMQNQLCQTLVISLFHSPDGSNIQCEKGGSLKGLIYFAFT